VIEAKWQKYWAENQTFAAANNSENKALCVRYVSLSIRAGLHVDILWYIASDVYARI
jgi:leucyl-tRNA synthetase